VTGGKPSSQRTDVSVTTGKDKVVPVLRYWTIGVIGSDSRRGLEILLLTTASRTALVFIQPPIQWVPGTFSLEVKRQECEADHSPPSSADVKACVELYLHSPNTPSWRAQSKKGEVQLYLFTCYLLPAVC
jgi:hypothetical protein